MVQLFGRKPNVARGPVKDEVALHLLPGLWLRHGFLLIVWMLLSTLGTGCERHSPLVHFILPQGFRGAIVVYVNQLDGLVLANTRGVYECRIPETGILKVRGEEPFYSWHRKRASYEDGTMIPVAQETENLADHVVAFWSGSSDSRGFFECFVGTKREAKVFYQETAAGDAKPGSVQKN